MALVRNIYWITGNRPDFFNPNQPMAIFPDVLAYYRPDVNELLFGIRDKSEIQEIEIVNCISGISIDSSDT